MLKDTFRMCLIINNYGITRTSDLSWKVQVIYRPETEKSSVPAGTAPTLFIKIPQPEKYGTWKFLWFGDTTQREFKKGMRNFKHRWRPKWQVSAQAHVTSLRFSQWSNQSYSRCWCAVGTFLEVGLCRTSSNWCEWDFISWKTKYGTD